MNSAAKARLADLRDTHVHIHTHTPTHIAMNLTRSPAYLRAHLSKKGKH